ESVKTSHHHLPKSFLSQRVRYLEVGRIHSQGEGVQLTEVQQTCCQVVDFGHGISNSSHHSLAVLLHRGRAGAQVLPVGEVGLGLGVHSQSVKPHPVKLNPNFHTISLRLPLTF
uniref:Uncharacterized protein n=1 Tax=Oryzias melastigma TaxID=30732 RepID=A0A3B3B4H3_ORYME